MMVAAPLPTFDDTLVEGELILRGSNLHYLIFRVLYFRGKSIMAQPLLDRAKLIHPYIYEGDGTLLSDGELHDTLRRGCIVPRHNKLTFHVKRAYPASAMMEVFKAEVAEHGSDSCDGVVLVPNIGHRDMLSKYPELKAKFCHTLDFALRLRVVKYKGDIKRHVEILYTLGDQLQDAHTLLLLGCDHVAVQVEDGDAFREWRAGSSEFKVDDMMQDVVEFRCVLTPLSRKAAQTWDMRDWDRVQRLRNERWQDGTRNNEQLLLKPRKFKFLLTMTFIKVRKDKTYPNTLPTIVSTLVQSNHMPMEKVATMVKAHAIRAALSSERLRGMDKGL